MPLSNNSSPALPIDANRPLLIGVDAGGTQTRAVLAKPGEGGRFCLLGTGYAGPGNPLSVGIDSACQALRLAIDQACEGIDQLPESAVLAVAGTRDPLAARAINDWAQQAAIAKRCQVVSDFEPMLALARGEGPAVGVIAGTGSVAFARDAAGNLHRHGGWGYLLGDEGSGYAIGRRALRTLLASASNETSWLEAIVAQQTGITNRSSLPAAIHAAADPRSLIASLARPVLIAAKSNLIAKQIVADEIQELAQAIMVVAQSAQLKKEQSLPLSLGGSVLLGSELARLLLLANLKEAGFRKPSFELVHDVIAGCLRLASINK